MLSHPHVVRCHTKAVNNEGMRVCLIMTDLVLTPDQRDFDQAAYDNLMEAAQSYLAEHPELDGVDVVRTE